MPADAVPAAESTPPPRRRRWGRLSVGLFVVVVGLAVAAALAVRFGPQLVARQVVRTYLDGLNIDTSGVETLRVRLAKGEFSFGPVTFRGADAEMGEVGRIGVGIDVSRLLRRQALVRSIVIEGVRFEVRQAEDGSFSLNGIPLGEILAVRKDSPEPPASEGEPQPAPPKGPLDLQKDLGWGAGLDLLDIRDSRIAFVDARGGEAVMHVHELELGGFRTWAADRPGHYRLSAELNEIGLTASGTAKPFADKIEVEAEAAVTGIEVTKIERFLGPLGFTSRGGEIDLVVQRAWIGVFAQGRVDARMAATGTLTGVDLAHPLFGSGQLAGGTLRLDDITASYDAARQTTVTGDLGIDLQASTLRFADGSEVAFSRAGFVLPGTRIKAAPGLQPEVSVAPRLDVDGLRLGGAGLRGEIGTASAQLSAFSIEGQQPGAPFFVTGKVAAERIDLLLPQATPVGIGAERIEIDLAKTRLAFPPGRGAQIEGGVVLDTRNLSVSVEGAATPGRRPPPPTRIGAGRLVFQLPALAFDDTGGGGPSLNAREPQLNVDALRLDGPAVRGSVDRAAVRLRDVNVAGAGAPLTGSGTVTMDRLDLLVPGEEPITFAAGYAQVDLVETRVALSPGAPPLAGGLVLELRDVLGTLQEIGRRGNPPPPLTTAEMARLTATVPAVTAARPYATAGSIGVAGPIVRMDRLRLGGADIQGTVRSADVRFDDIGVETAAPGPPVVATGKIMARDLDLVIPDLDPIGIAAREFNADLSRTRYAFPSQRVLIDGDFGLDMKDFGLRLYQHAPEGKPAPQPTRISASRFAGKLPRLVIAERRRTSLKIDVATPGLTFDGFGLEAAAGSDALVRLASSVLALRRAEVGYDSATTTMDVAVKAGVTAPDLSVVMVPQNGSTGAQAQIGGLDVDLRRVAYHREGEAKGVGLQGRIGMGSMQGQLPPRRPGEAADRLALTGLKLDLTDVDLTTRGDRPAWRARLDLALKSLAATLRQPLPLTASVDDISVAGLAANSGEEYTVGDLTLGRFDASVTRETPPRPRPVHEPAEAAGPSASWPPADLPVVRIGRAALLQGGRIAFRDTTLSPTADATLAIDTLSLDNLDTADPAARTRLRLNGRLDDAVLAVDGWAEAFQAKPSFAMQGRIDDLHLPSLSPFLGPRLGLDFLRGDLSVDATVAATGGQLDGNARIRMTDVRVADRPSAGGDEITRSIGVPLSTLIRLMEDGDGGIRVNLPIQGDLASPGVDTRRVIWGLLPRVARAFVRSPVGFVSSARSLVRATRTEGAAPSATPVTQPDTAGLDVAPAAGRLAADGLPRTD